MPAEETIMENQPSITFDDVLLVPNYNPHQSRRDVDISMKDKTGKLTLSLPILTANMDTITEYQMARWINKKGGAGVLHRFMDIESNVLQYKLSVNEMDSANTFVSVGASIGELKRAHALFEIGARYFCVDVAHGHANYVGKMIAGLRSTYGDDICIMAGNVASYAGAKYLADSGADIIKVGIGPGSVCTTRIKTGFGVPQLTAIQECSKVDRSIVADGGLKTPGDIVKALAFGADFVMVGGMLAGTAPTPGDPVIQQEYKEFGTVETKYKVYRGMASKDVADEYLGGLTEWKTAEGVATKVKYREDQDDIIADIVGGLRSGLTYGGSATIKELQKNLNYRIITPAGRIESLPHKIL